MIDTSVLGQTAARCMEDLDNHEELDGGAIEAVMIVVVAQTKENDRTYSRIFSSETSHWKQLGLIETAKEVCQDGDTIEEGGEE